MVFPLVGDYERAMGVEPTSSAWKAEVLAIELRPQAGNRVPERTLRLARRRSDLAGLLRSAGTGWALLVRLMGGYGPGG